MLKSFQKAWFCNFKFTEYVWIVAGEGKKYIFSLKSDSFKSQIYKMNRYNYERILQKKNEKNDISFAWKYTLITNNMVNN